MINKKKKYENIKYKGKTYTIQGIILNDLRKKIEIEKKNEKGFIYISNKNTKPINYTVRDFDIISYRLLSFILNSNIFYSYLLGNNIDLKIDDILNNIFEHWLVLKENLKLNKINIQIFLNMIFKDFKNSIKNITNFDTPDSRYLYENNFNNIIIQSINKYNNFEKNYLILKNNILEIKEINIKHLIEETEFLDLNEDEFPYSNYFYYPSLVNIESFSKKINKKYPVIYNYINKAYNNSKLNLIHNISHLNKLENILINKYSYKISRDDAKNKIIKYELNDINDELFIFFNKFYNKFIDNVDILRNYCHEIKEKHHLNENDKLSYILNDNGELGYGYTLLCIYSEIIKIQNEFINDIFIENKTNQILNSISDEVHNKICIQDCTENEMIDINIKNDIFDDINELICVYSIRDIFEKNKINYKNYKNIKYDFEKIEIEFSKILLIGKRLLSKEQKMIIYQFEEYRNKTDIIKLYKENYPQEKLKKDDIKKISDYLKNNENEYKNILSSLKLLIYYLYNKDFNNQDNIFKKIIPKMPKLIKLSDNCLNFFHHLNSIKLSELIDTFEFVELICFEIIIDNLNIEYKEKIDEKIINDINEYFNNKDFIYQYEFFEKKILANAIRKYISRYISGKRADDNNLKLNIFLSIASLSDIWDNDIFNNENFQDFITDLSMNININHKFILEFYYILQNK